MTYSNSSPLPWLVGWWGAPEGQGRAGNDGIAGGGGGGAWWPSEVTGLDAAPGSSSGGGAGGCAGGGAGGGQAGGSSFVILAIDSNPITLRNVVINGGFAGDGGVGGDGGNGEHGGLGTDPIDEYIRATSSGSSMLSYSPNVLGGKGGHGGAGGDGGPGGGGAGGNAITLHCSRSSIVFEGDNAITPGVPGIGGAARQHQGENGLVIEQVDCY